MVSEPRGEEDGALCSMVIVGEAGRSKACLLATHFRKDAKNTLQNRSRLTLADGALTQHLEYRSPTDLGTLGFIEVEFSGLLGGGGPWFLRRVTVEKIMDGGLASGGVASKTWVFAGYSHLEVGNKNRLMEGKCYLHEPWWLAEMRGEVMQRPRRDYTWEEEEGLPRRSSARHVSWLPLDEQYGDESRDNVMLAAANAIVARGLDEYVGNIYSWQGVYETHLTSIYKCFSGDVTEAAAEGDPRFPMPLIGERGRFRWQDDYEFARQFLGGGHPLMLRKSLEVPENFLKIPHRVLDDYLRDGLALQDEAMEGRVFIADYKPMQAHMEQLGEGADRFRCAPQCLFLLVEDPRRRFSEDGHALMPIGIQLEHGPGASLFTPADPENVWRLAKAFVASADAHFHIAVSLYLDCHVCLEPLALACRTELTPLHPVYKLLQPYMKHFLAHCITMREAVNGKNGLFEGFFSQKGKDVRRWLQEMYSVWDPKRWNLMNTLAERGLDGVDNIPDFPYRDDGLLLWGAIADFVQEYVGVYYASDLDVLEDPDIQRWFKEGFLESHAGCLVFKNMNPDQKVALDSRAMLCDLLTSIIWLRTGQVSAMRGGIFDYNAFVPNRPWSLRRPPPDSKEEISNDEYLDFLPGQGDTASVIAVASVLSHQEEAQAEKGELLENWITEPRAMPALKRFHQSLVHVEAMIQVRNEGRLVPYPYLQPSEIPSIGFKMA